MRADRSSPVHVGKVRSCMRDWDVRLQTGGSENTNRTDRTPSAHPIKNTGRGPRRVARKRSAILSASRTRGLTPTLRLELMLEGRVGQTVGRRSKSEHDVRADLAK